MKFICVGKEKSVLYEYILCSVDREIQVYKNRNLAKRESKRESYSSVCVICMKVTDKYLTKSSF